MVILTIKIFSIPERAVLTRKEGRQQRVDGEERQRIERPLKEPGQGAGQAADGGRNEELREEHQIRLPGPEGRLQLPINGGQLLGQRLQVVALADAVHPHLLEGRPLGEVAVGNVLLGALSNWICFRFAVILWFLLLLLLLLLKQNLAKAQLAEVTGVHLADEKGDLVASTGQHLTEADALRLVAGAVVTHHQDLQPLFLTHFLSAVVLLEFSRWQEKVLKRLTLTRECFLTRLECT